MLWDLTIIPVMFRTTAFTYSATKMTSLVKAFVHVLSKYKCIFVSFISTVGFEKHS